MSYNSDRISQFDVRRFKDVLDQFNLNFYTVEQKLAFAEALELKAAELRADAVRDDSVPSSDE